MQVSKLGLCPYVTSSVIVGWVTPKILANSRTLIFSALILALTFSINSTGACLVVMEYKITDLVIDIFTIMVTQLDSFIRLPIMVEKSTIMKSIKTHMTNNAANQIILGKLIENIQKSMRSLVEFLKILVLGMIAALLLVLPWLLRAAALLIWLAGGYAAITTIQFIYSPFSQYGEILVLQSAAIILLIAIALLLTLAKQEFLWGGLAIGGALFVSVSYGMTRLWNTEYGGLILRALPAALLAVSMIAMSVRLKKMRTSGGVRFSAPLFVWLKKSPKGGDASSPE